MNAQLAPAAYSVANQIVALWSSETVMQSTFEMEATEFVEFVASHVAQALEGAYVPAAIVRKHQHRGTTITDRSALAMLANTSPQVQATYRRLRRLGANVPTALNAAVKKHAATLQAEDY